MEEKKKPTPQETPAPKETAEQPVPTEEQVVGNHVIPKIIIEYGNFHNSGLEVRISEDTIIPPNEILLRGIMDQASDMLIGFLIRKKLDERANKEASKIEVVKDGGGSLIKSLRNSSFGKKILH